MLLYLSKRIGLAVVVILVIMAMLALLVNLVPGDPARIILGPHATPQLIAEIRRTMGLDNPFYVQVWDFIWGAVRGNLGTDPFSKAPVASELGTPLLNTLALSVVSLVLSIVVGVPLGIVAAVRQGGIVDAVVRGASILLLSAPAYVIGLLLLLGLSVRVHFLPALGSGSFSDFGNYLERLVMPAVALSAFWWAYLARLVRSSMLEVLGEAFVRTSRAYGLKERVIRYRVALKNALVPVMALTGLMVGYILSGTVYVEVIFERTGLGNLAVASIGNRNWPVVRAIVLIYGAAFIIGNLLADVAYRFLDPRLRLEERADIFI
ncbi:MAG: ABC transporter permease [Acidimicrobiales bacterium]